MLPTNSDFEFKFTLETDAKLLSEDSSFHILFLGDWSADGAKKDLSERSPIVIDRDNFDEVLRKLDVRLDLDLNSDNNSLTIEIKELEDFHPDNLYRQISLFSDLRELRNRLLNPDSFDAAVRQVREWFDTSKTGAASDPKHEIPVDNNTFSDNSLLDKILSHPPESSKEKPLNNEYSELDKFISKIISNSLVKIDETEQSKLVAVVNEAVSKLMRTILHHPRFQQLESAWRGLYFLIRQVETDAKLKIFILDVSQQEIVHKLKSVNNLADSFLFRRVVDEPDKISGIKPFAVICGNYSFGVDVEDISTLMRIAKIADAAEVPFISYIRPEMFGIKSLFEIQDSSQISFSEETKEGKLWTALRVSPEADFVALSPMRFLGRLPYGESTEPIDSFQFEEFTTTVEPEKYLWINPSFAFALLFAKSFSLFGLEEMSDRMIHNIEGLPVYFFHMEDETKNQSCAEIFLTEKSLNVLLQQGLIPLLSFRDTDTIKIARFQSISLPLKTLKGKWSR